MTNATMTDKMTLLREDILPRLTKQAATLTELAAKPNADVPRLTAKAAAVTKIIKEQGDLLANVKTHDDAVIIMCIIRMVSKHDGADEDGTRLALSTIRSYLS